MKIIDAKQVLDLKRNHALNMARSYRISEHFTWGEVLGNLYEKEEHEVTLDMLQGAERLVKVLEELRTKYGKPITIKSWLRPPSYNRRVGGASQSRHMHGDAADFLIQGVDNHKVFNDLKNWHGGLAIKYRWDGSVVFIHLDLGGKRRWEYSKG